MKTEVGIILRKLASVLLCLFTVFTAQAAINLTLTPTNGTCVSDCKITASATGTTGTVTYAIISTPSGPVTPSPQSSNVFDYLLPGTYTIGVYDATTAGTPVTKNVTVTTSYVQLLANPPVVSFGSNQYCGNNGTLHISFTGGKAPFRIKITNTTTGVSTEITGNATRQHIFSNLASGDYIFEVEDACEQWVQNVPGTYTAVSTVNDLSTTTFTSIAFSDGSNSYVQFNNNSNCNNILMYLYYTDIKIYLDGTASTLPVSSNAYTNIKIRVEYPAASSNFSSWQNIYTWPSFSFTNFNRSQTNGDKFRIQVQHPCSNAIITSPVYTIADPVFRYEITANATSYCNQDLSINLNSSASSGSTIDIRNRDGCGPYTVELRDASDILIDTKTTPSSGTGNTAVQFDNVTSGVTYKAIITSTSGFLQTINDITISAPNYNKVIFIEFDNIAGGYIGYYNRGYNAIFCDYETTAVGLWAGSSLIDGLSVKFSIEAVAPTPAIIRPQITVTNDNGRILWDNIPWGTYDITVDYGCTTYTYRKVWTKKIDGFTVASVTLDNSVVCGTNDIVADAYYHLNGNRIQSSGEPYRYWMLIVDGPAKIGERADGYNNGSSTGPSPGVRLSNVPSGTYKLLFYPYEIPVSTQIVNGKTVNNYPSTMRDCYLERTITVPEYVRPIINIPLSGGITCTSTGQTNLTVNVLQGSKPPFLYRYKVKGASDDTYTPQNFQTGNVFPNMSKGDYTVQVKDDCGSITTQDIHIFDGTEQFVGIIGEVLPGIVCESREVVLSVLSIGPVQSYLWRYRPNSLSSWTVLSSTSATYVIPSAQQTDKGQYQVEINNGICNLTSAIEIIDVLPPPGTPTITCPNSVICLGGSTTFTANTSVTSPNYQWYKDGLPVGTNSSTYSATAAGSYTVVITPSSGCPSDPSATFTVTEQIPAHPDVADLSADAVCNGGHPVIHLATSQLGVTYHAYESISGGLSLGSVVGTGSAVDITLSATPASNTTYYIGAILNSCSSASRTPVSVTIVSTPATPTVNSVPAMCSGTTFSITVASPNASYYYKVYDASTGGNLLGQSATGSGTISGLTATASTTYYVSAVLSAGCESNRTNVTITVNQNAVAADITADDVTICYNTAATLTASSSIPGATYKWYETQISTAVLSSNASYPTPVLTATKTYYVSVSGTGYCENVSGSRKAVKVTVLPDLLSGAIAANQTIVSGQTPALLTSVSGASGGTGLYDYRWQRSVDGGNTWTNITENATSATYSPPAITVPTQYRRKVTSGTCIAYSNVVTIVPVSPLSLQYSACPGASITVGFYPASGVQYYWYTEQTNGSPISGGSNVNTLPAITVTSAQTWWVEPRYAGISLPRYKVELKISTYCATLTPSGCAATGTLIYKEDFGGNETGDVSPSPVNLLDPGLIDLVFCPSCNCVVPTYGYCFTKTYTSTHSHLQMIGGGDDHTFPGDKTRGYFMSIDPAPSNMNYKVYGSVIKGLCTGTNLSFTLWAYDWHQGNAGEARPKIEMLIRDAKTYDTIVTSGIITLHRESPAQNHIVWRQYGFDFSIPAGIDSILFTIVNKEVNNVGNDWFLDDIEVHLCAPPVILTQPTKSDTTVCAGTSFTFAGSYTDDGTFGSNLISRWERNVTGDLNNPDAWTAVAGTQNSSTSGTVSNTYSITSVATTHSGYYRLVVANAANIDNYNCRAMSDIIRLQVVTGVISGTVSSDRTICYNNIPPQLTSTSASGGSVTLTYQWQQSTDGGNTWINAIGGTGPTTPYYTPPALIQTTKYRLKTVGGTAPCETAYSNVVTITIIPRVTAADITTKDTTICYNTTATLTASSSIPGATYKWYETQTSTAVLSSNASYLTPALIATKTYYVGVSGTNYCENATNNRKAVTVTVKNVCAVADNATASCDLVAITINVLNNDILSPGCASPTVTVVVQPKNGAANVTADKKIEYTGATSGLDSLTYRITCGGDFSEAKVYITVSAIADAFVDDIWYFGRNGQGIRFVNNSGVYSVVDASGESKVDSHENSLVVSSPYCDGQKIFYASHHQLYNSQHELMAHGHFMGHESVADGLAACYMGNNKYLFFSVTNAYEAGNRGLKAYIVDMNADNGKGDIIDSVSIEPASANMSESIELIAAAEAHKYWLVYAYKTVTHHELRVCPVDVTKSLNLIVGAKLTPSVATSTTSDRHTYTLKTSPQHNRLAIANSDDKTVDVFDFNNLTGVISNRRTTSTALTERIDGIAYGVEFSPDGNQLYAAGYTTVGGSPVLCQYTIHSGSLEFKDRIKYWTQTAYNTKGSGMKLGPDGRIYVKLAYDSNIGVISNPNATTALLDRYDNTGIAPNGFHVNVTVGNYALRFSTGLTKPSIMECNANNAPVTLLDETEFCITATLQTTKVNVLLNDSDPENSTIFLTGAVFVNPADTLLATLTVNAADSTVSLTVKPNAYLGIAGHVFDVVYNVKDNGLPASQCATGSLRITAHPTPNYPDIRVHVCPDVGNVNLSKYLDTTNGVKTNDIQWTSQMPGISITSPAGTVSTSDFKSSVRIYTFTYTISSRCVADQKRKAYIEVLNDSRQLKHKDTVVICYKYAEAVQINQLFGVEAQGGYWNYPAVIDPAIVGPLYIKESSSGAVVMNGKEIYENVSSLTGNYHGLTNVKIVKITYKANNSCLLDPEYDVVIVLTENILN